MPSVTNATTDVTFVKTHAKSVLAFVFGAVAFVTHLLTAGKWNAGDTTLMISWLATALGVEQVSNVSTTTTTSPSPETQTTTTTV